MFTTVLHTHTLDIHVTRIPGYGPVYSFATNTNENLLPLTFTCKKFGKAFRDVMIQNGQVLSCVFTLVTQLAANLNYSSYKFAWTRLPI